MTLLFFLIVGLLIGLLRGGGLSGLALAKVKGIWLLIIPLLVEVEFYAHLIIPRLPQTAWLMLAVQTVRFLPILLFVILNARDWRVALAGAGVLLNFLVIMLNGGKMPIIWTVANIPELAASVQRVADGRVVEYFVMTGPGAANLWYLGDVIVYRVNALGFASAGDIVLGIGVMLFVQNCMVRFSFGKHLKNNLKAGLEREEQQPEPLDEPQVPAVQETTVQPAAEIPVAKPAKAEKAEKKKRREPAPEMMQDLSESDEYAETDEPLHLTPRLVEIAAMIPRYAAVADIGCDHGKLAAHLAMRGASKVIATDVSSGSLAKTVALVKKLGLAKHVRTRLCSGLEKIKPGEVDVIVMAGMGGMTIAGILQKGYKVAHSAQSLVLQPMNAPGTVRRWLLEHGFTIVDESLAQEDERIYQVIKAIPQEYKGKPQTLFELEVGDILLEKRHPLLGAMMADRIRLIDDILNEIADNNTPKADARRSELLSLRGRCMEVYEWLQSEI